MVYYPPLTINAFCMFQFHCRWPFRQVHACFPTLLAECLSKRVIGGLNFKRLDVVFREAFFVYRADCIDSDEETQVSSIVYLTADVLS